VKNIVEIKKKDKKKIVLLEKFLEKNNYS